jgi:hypothetical protein
MKIQMVERNHLQAQLAGSEERGLSVDGGKGMSKRGVF